MTPATVDRVFAAAGVPIVRYARPPDLCDAHGCGGIDYLGSGPLPAFLAPRVKPTFEVIVFKTPDAAREIARLASGERRGNAVLIQRRASRRIRRIFERILP